MNNPKFDIVIYGATSFVGKITVEYFLKQYGVNKSSIRWAIAARSKNKLAELKNQLGDDALDLPVLVANSNDEKSLNSLCDQTKLIISTVGPYALYGEPLVKACAESGTHYCDLTGETQWIAEMLEKYESAAQQSGAMIVNCCGFDSIPSDLGVFFLQQKAYERFGETCGKVEMGVKAGKGGFSGGTVASLLNVMKEASNDPELRKKLGNPYLLCPDDSPSNVRQRTDNRYYSEALKSWCAPFVMASINTRIVHRSNALQNNSYSDNFLYSEYTMTGDGNSGRAKSLAMTGGMGGFMAILALPPTRWLAEKTILPKPGEGPSPKEQEEGFFNLLFAGTASNGEVIKTKVTGDRDPGYGSTGKMLSEAAICILETAEKGEKTSGFWTPASLMGNDLIERLTENAGLTFEVIK